ncbi:hypothetical protein [Lancefieldella parvula]|uniref:hypothetical protein n=1 Tax=Lancefieldella parvula TaxID=1382 RepID=UPI0028D5AC2B|nr:hypothetical protein [Lancefieldella parvula]
MEAADKNFNKKGRRQAIYLEFLVPPARFERATCGLEVMFFTAHYVSLRSISAVTTCKNKFLSGVYSKTIHTVWRQFGGSASNQLVAR